MSDFKRKTQNAKLKNGIMSAALVLTGVVEFFEELEEGTGKGRALGRAVRRTQERGEALAEASRKTTRRKRAQR